MRLVVVLCSQTEGRPARVEGFLNKIIKLLTLEFFWDLGFLESSSLCVDNGCCCDILMTNHFFCKDDPHTEKNID